MKGTKLAIVVTLVTFSSAAICRSSKPSFTAVDHVQRTYICGAKPRHMVLEEMSKFGSPDHRMRVIYPPQFVGEGAIEEDQNPLAGRGGAKFSWTDPSNRKNFALLKYVDGKRDSSSFLLRDGQNYEDFSKVVECRLSELKSDGEIAK